VLVAARGDLIITLDAELKDSLSLIDKLFVVWEQSDAYVVLARRLDRTTDSSSKRVTT